jgi:hypothetical protein
MVVRFDGGCLGILPSVTKLEKRPLLDHGPRSGVQYARLPVPFCLRLRQVNRADNASAFFEATEIAQDPVAVPALAPARRQKQSEPLSTAVGAHAAS